MVSDDWQPDLLGLAGIPSQLQSTMRQDRVLIFLGMIDDLILVGKGADILLVGILFRDWQVVWASFFNHCQQLARIEIVNGTAQLNPVIGNPGDGTRGIEDSGRLVAGSPLEDVNGVRNEDLGDDEDQNTDRDVAPQVEGRFMVMLNEGGGGNGDSQQEQGVGNHRQPVWELEIVLEARYCNR